MKEVASTKKCLICKRPNDTLHWHESDDGGLPWVWCQGVCQRAYSMYEYTATAGLTLKEFLNNKFDIKEAPPNELQKMSWPSTFVPLFDQRSKEGVKYLSSRGIDPDDGMYYDTMRDGIVFPYYYGQTFVGAQIRFIENFVDYSGVERKIDTMPGTRLGLLFYGWNQSPMLPNIKGVIVTEGAFNSICIAQALSKVYGGYTKSPWKCMATSGSGASAHQVETIKILKENGTKIVLAPDSDEAGMKMFEKFTKAGAVTHYAFTEKSDQDWNDISSSMDKENFAKWFLGRIKSVKRS